MELQSELGAMLTTTGDDAQCSESSPEPCQLPQDTGGSEEGGDVPSASQHSPALQPAVEEEVPHPSTTEDPAEHQESRSRGAQEELPTQRESDASPGGAPQAAAEPPSTRSPTREPEPDFYCVKWITWKGERTPIITQSENGPCPLLAIMNILFLQWKVSTGWGGEGWDCILSIKPQENSEGLQLNFQQVSAPSTAISARLGAGLLLSKTRCCSPHQNVNDTMMVLPKLSTGLDVNVRFTGVSDFEYTPECIVFDLLNVPLYHGWLVDPQSPEVVRAVGKLSYNQLVEKIITCKHSGDPNLVTEGLIAEQFLESTASQLTYHGLCELTAAVKEEELSVFFRNNHFSTMIKHKGHLYLLVTDQGFLQEERVVWESLHNVDGDSCFCDTQFHLSHALGKEAAAPEQSQLDQGRAQQGGRPTPERRQRHKQNSDCILL
ncbi:hypothetical protein CIB84_013881 [Bambusicola thoracicus]|uniref:Ubiquitin carboxyl-terminal hydrolase n=1 Tax=Bambusicola thoracicus TaxID=9083 RepID=A0A2P4SE32_BAMTH|nr:hypothetical protein CIB84_013881 [Bambusicola thoracicus]